MYRRQFPLDLVSEVMTHVCDTADRGVPTLKAMSLVCRLWGAISRPCVFRRVTVISQRSLDLLAAFLCSRPEIISFIRALVVHPDSRLYFISTSWVADVPRILGPLLTALRTLELVGIQEIHAQLDNRFISALAGFVAVESLTADSFFVSPRVLHAVLGALPALRNVALISWPSAGGIDGAALPLGRSPRLEVLDIRLAPAYHDETAGILPWLATTETRQSIRSLSITVRSYDSDRVGRFIWAVGAHLEHLELELQDFFGLPLEKDAMKKNISIANCQRLRSFAVRDNDVLSVAVVGITSASLPNSETLPNLSPQGHIHMEIARDMTQDALPRVHSRGVLARASLTRCSVLSFLRVRSCSFKSVGLLFVGHAATVQTPNVQRPY